MLFNELKKNIKKDFSGLKQFKLALLGDSSTQLLAQAIRGSGYDKRLNIHVFDADYNQVDRLIMNVASELYVYKPDYTVIFEAGYKLIQKFNKINEAERFTFAENRFDRISKLIDVLQSNIKTKVICFNYAEEDDRVFGNFANNVQSSFIFQQRKLNYMLTEHSVRNAGFHICDISSIQNRLGRDLLFSPSIYVNTESVLRIDTLLKKFGLESRKANNVISNHQVFDIDFSHIPPILEFERKKAFNSLKKALCVKKGLIMKVD